MKRFQTFYAGLTGLAVGELRTCVVVTVCAC